MRELIARMQAGQFFWDLLKSYGKWSINWMIYDDLPTRNGGFSIAIFNFSFSPWEIHDLGNRLSEYVLLFFGDSLVANPMDLKENPNGKHTKTAWWFGTWLDYDFPFRNFILPFDEIIFFRGVGLNHQPGKSYGKSAFFIGKSTISMTQMMVVFIPIRLILELETWPEAANEGFFFVDTKDWSPLENLLVI